MSAFPVTSATLIQKIKTLPPGKDNAAWVRFWDTYSGAIRQFASRKGGEENADDIVMAVLGKLVDVLRSGQYVPEKGAFHSYLSTMIINEVHMLHRREMARGADRRVDKNRNMTVFTGIFPVSAPQYIILIMLDEPQGTKESGGWKTAAWNAVPTAGAILDRIMPLLFE